MSNFIELLDSEGYRIVINKYHVTLLEPNREYTRILLSGNNSRTVKMYYKELIKLLENTNECK